MFFLNTTGDLKSPIFSPKLFQEVSEPVSELYHALSWNSYLRPRAAPKTQMYNPMYKSNLRVYLKRIFNLVIV